MLISSPTCHNYEGSNHDDRNSGRKCTVAVTTTRGSLSPHPQLTLS